MLRIHSYESMGTFDGPGLRLVVFLQGCNSAAFYCANSFDTRSTPAGESPRLRKRSCAWPQTQKPFFRRRGGVTFGGEPTFQPGGAGVLPSSAARAGIHVRPDSNGGVWNPRSRSCWGWSTPVLRFDVKQADPGAPPHAHGRDNAQIVTRTAAWLEEHGVARGAT